MGTVRIYPPYGIPLEIMARGKEPRAMSKLLAMLRDKSGATANEYSLIAARVVECLISGEQQTWCAACSLNT